MAFIPTADNRRRLQRMAEQRRSQRGRQRGQSSARPGRQPGGVRQTLLDHLQRLQDPSAGRRQAVQTALSAAPTADQALTLARARGGSHAQARVRTDQARSEAVSQALSGFEQTQLRRQQGATQGLLGLLQSDRQRATARERTQLQRSQLDLQRRRLEHEQEGPGLGGILGTIAGTAAGSFFGPLGAAAGGSIANRIFGSAGDENVFGGFDTDGQQTGRTAGLFSG